MVIPAAILRITLMKRNEHFWFLVPSTKQWGFGVATPVYHSPFSIIIRLGNKAQFKINLRIWWFAYAFWKFDDVGIRHDFLHCNLGNRHYNIDIWCWPFSNIFASVVVVDDVFFCVVVVVAVFFFFQNIVKRVRFFPDGKTILSGDEVGILKVGH